MKSLKIGLGISIMFNLILLTFLFLGLNMSEDVDQVGALPCLSDVQTDDGAMKQAVVSEATLPKDVYVPQVYKVVDEQYAIVVMPNLNIYLQGLGSVTPTFKGLLQWNVSSGVWEKMLAIEDLMPEVSKSNNIIDLWFEGNPETDQIPHLLVMDTNGAGSGEGVAKEYVLTELGWNAWALADCYNYALDLGKLPGKVDKKQCEETVRITSLR